MDRKKRVRKQNAQARSLLRELRGYEREGTQLYLDERPSRADEIVHACLLSEDTDYMRDLVSDDREHITEIHFIRISEED